MTKLTLSERKLRFAQIRHADIKKALDQNEAFRKKIGITETSAAERQRRELENMDRHGGGLVCPYCHRRING
ncbi:hypothetical protein [Permianibacter aggregans]|uniref:hypothetical protein n=1 Tax=Permianibacter aggregans TaxID=1510150 RepID=UPI00105B8635|nr:hypothetical protein [Permianibacter aggregans]QGX40153.1 hypothetical protein E2H98_10915 [Permianibacter aggregans]